MSTLTPTRDGAALTAGMVIQSTEGLPAELQIAQRAMALPEVQDMLRRLADFNLGIYMPHLHEDGTGRFLPLPEHLVQVEDDLNVSFQTEEQLVQQQDPLVQIGWLWRGDGAQAIAHCVSWCKRMGTGHDKMHKLQSEEGGGGDSSDSV